MGDEVGEATVCLRRINCVGSPAGKLPRGSGAAPVKTGGGNRAAEAKIRLRQGYHHLRLVASGSLEPHSPLLYICFTYVQCCVTKKHPFGGVFLRLVRKVREGAVGLGHAVAVLFLLESGTRLIVGVDDFQLQTLSVRHTLAVARGLH